MSLVRALRPKITGIGARSDMRPGWVGLLLVACANLGCHVFTPGLSPRDASGYSNPDSTTLPISDTSDEDALSVATQEPLSGTPSQVGCADGTREGFRDLKVWPFIAGCAGSWLKPGLPISVAAPRPCSGLTANSSDIQDGQLCTRNRGCTPCAVADLCAPDWHLCMDEKAVSKLSPTGCEDILPPGERGFFITMTGASANGVCAPNERNDLHGCGNVGHPESSDCSPLTRRMGFADCANTDGVWSCGTAAESLDEADVVIKPSSDLGGVLCCKD